MRIFPLIFLVHLGSSTRPLSKPKNFPNRGPLSSAANQDNGGSSAGGTLTSVATGNNPPFGYEERPPAGLLSSASSAVGTVVATPAYESSFPVFNVRFTYPPTVVDARRRLGLAERQDEILDNFFILEKRISRDLNDVMKHVSLQNKIVQKIASTPWSTRNGIQESFLKSLALAIPEVPPGSSFFQQAAGVAATPAAPARNMTDEIEETPPPPGTPPNPEEYPQINIAVEDNSADFVPRGSMSPNRALKYMQEIQQSVSENRGMAIVILEQNLKIFELLESYLEKPMRNAAAGRPVVSFLQQLIPDPLPTVPPGWYSENVTAPSTPLTGVKTAGKPVNTTVSINSSISPAGSSSYSPPMGIAFPFYMRLRGRVMEGGREGAKALATLINLWNDQAGARDAIRRTMVLVDCKLLMIMPNTPDYIKNLAGSLVTLMSGTPTGSSVTDEVSGSYGHVNVIVPRPSRVYAADKEIAIESDPPILEV